MSTELTMLAEMAARQGATVEDKLTEAGWVQGEPGAAGLRRTWQRDGVVVTQYGRGSEGFVEITTEMVKPDDEDPDSEDELLDQFEAKFSERVRAAEQVLGAPTFIGDYGDEGWPADIDAVSTAQWDVEGGRVGVNFKHEDMGVPFRITLTAS